MMAISPDGVLILGIAVGLMIALLIVIALRK